MIRFVSTRGSGPVSFAEALFRGLAPDGGLYVPESVPELREPIETTALATAWLDGTASLDAIERATRDALDFPIPLVQIEPDVYVLELFHGPTLAFKDVGARFMARVMRALDEADGSNPRRTVLVATSGDTGSAVAHAFLGIPGYRVIVLFPFAGVSERQRRQMTTLGGNVTALAVNGTFDDCQRMAKQAFADRELAEAAGLTSANSINVGRLIPQSFYYRHAAAQLEEAATFVVPSGNLGNLTGGLLAQRSGMNAEGFVAASNKNRVFPDYLDTGEVHTRVSLPSHSNAMDVGDPSNLERILWMYDGDVERVRASIRGTSSSDEETADEIRSVAERTGYVMDPHTAVGYAGMRKLELPVGPKVLLATAHPAKFPKVVESAIGQSVDVPSRLSARLEAAERYERIQPDIAALSHLILEDVDT